MYRVQEVSTKRTLSKNVQLTELYTLSKRWILRNDPNFSPQYLLFDVHSGDKFKISDITFVMLKIWGNDRLSLNEMWEYLSDSGIVLHRDEFFNFANRLIDQKVIVPFDKTIQSYTQSQIVISHRAFENCDVPIASTPYEAEIHFTNACNLKCLHCGYDAGHKLRNELNPEIWCKVFDELERLRTIRIIISGGEPLLYSGSKLLMKYLATKRVSVTVLTNGTLIDKEFADLFASNNFSVSVSLDGAKAETHDELRGVRCFNRVVKNMELLSLDQIPFNIDTTIHRKNIDQIEDIIKLAVQVGAGFITFGVLYPVGRARSINAFLLDHRDINFISKKIKEVQSIYGRKIHVSYVNPLFPNYRDIFGFKETKKIFCPGGTSRLAIRSDGAVFPCQYGFHDDKFKMGSIKSQTIGEIWTSSNWKLFRGGLSIQELHRCRTCKLSNVCLLKICRLMAYSSTGDFFAPPPGCEWVMNSI